MASLKKTKATSEDILLAYFSELWVTKKALWPIYSMVKSTLSVFENVDISPYKKLISFLKRKCSSVTVKKSEKFQKKNFQKNPLRMRVKR